MAKAIKLKNITPAIKNRIVTMEGWGFECLAVRQLSDAATLDEIKAACGEDGRSILAMLDDVESAAKRLDAVSSPYYSDL